MIEHSKELVPLTYARDAYNTLHGTQLEHHDDHLTAEQAQRINGSFDIEAYVGTHGIGIDGQATSADQLFNAPTQQEYEEAAAVVNSLQPGDTLFTKGTVLQSSPVKELILPANSRLYLKCLMIHVSKQWPNLQPHNNKHLLICHFVSLKDNVMDIK